jgi:Ca2+-binding RTX toxin-like protein
VRIFTLNATDAPVDQAAGFTFSINWGDGTTQTVTGLSGTTVEHIYTASGNYTVSVTATDKDGGVSATVTRTITVDAVEVQDGTLVVGGTTGADVINVTPGVSNGSYIVTILSPTPGGTELTVAVVSPNSTGYEIDLTVGNVHVGLFGIPTSSPLTHLEIYAQAGDDMVTISNAVNLLATVFGGDGNDLIKAGGANSILVGGAGDDTLIGGNGRDILIGGTGSDHLIGQNGDDLLIGGQFLAAAPSQEALRIALQSVAATWDSSASFDDRVAALSAYLAPRVDDDGVSDQLNGGGGSDWYWAHITGPVNNRDVLNGVTPHDLVTTI